MAEGAITAADIGDGFISSGSEDTQAELGELRAGLLRGFFSGDPESVMQGRAPKFPIEEIELVVESGVG